jgi:translation initiation factor IF-2
MAIKISKVAKDLNVGISTLVEFLQKNNQNVEDNLNTRITDEQYEMLVRAFKNDKDLKSKSDKYSSDRHKEKAKPAPAPHVAPKEEIKTVVVPQPKVVGKINLDEINKPKVVETPKPQKAEEKPVEKPVEKAPVKPVAEPAPAKAEPAVAPAKAPEAPKPAPEININKGLQVNTETNEIKTVVETISAPKIVGKINLDELNQQTRPKKKTKEEKRRERLANKGNNGNAEGADQKKKRKRIGKEKVDIENSSNQNAAPGGRGDDNQKRGGKNKQDRQPKVKRHIKPEVSEEDVQKQIKETLARLTNKPQKKSAKWRKEKREAFEEREREEAELEREESKILRITEFVTANDLALMMDVPVNKIIATCMNIGVMVSINQRLDAETINIVAEEFGFKTEYVSAEVSEAIAEEEDDEESLQQRPPIVTVMGHVDHGKTSLLDYIRNANVIAGEAGGITQHIGAYNVKLDDGRRITFLDTPGHEAFTAMRARGAKMTDIAIIIVAADDNVMPQTVEAINHASAAGVPIVFAINKIDKPNANPDKIKEELANMNYLVEDWGGKYQSQEISAKKGTGVAELMEKVLLEAELLDLKANPNRKAVGTVIESSLDKGRGYVATVLVQNGTLNVGDIMVAGTSYGKIRAMFNERNQRVTTAGPSAPVLVLGLNGATTAGDTFNILDSDREAREIANRREQLQRELKERTRRMPGLDDIARRRALGEFHELNLIVKGDVDGSIEALSDSLIKLSTPEVQVNVIHKAVGAISESDVTLASASDAVIIGFQVRPSVAAKRLAENDGVDIRLYSIIYDAIEEVKDAMAGMLSPEIKEEVTGTAEVLQTYKISRVGTIAGCMVREGKIKRTSKVRLIRDGIVIYTGDLGSLKRFKDDVKEVASGYDCGLNINNYNDVKEGDMIEAFEEIEVSKKL